MKIITCASYYGSGSSAITDLVSEFSSVQSLSEEEFRFIHDPDGISDLEYNLVENFNRHNSGHALKRFKKIVDFYSGNIITKRYEKYFLGNWKKCSYEFIDNLTDFTYFGWWQYDLLDRGTFFYFRKRVINKILKSTVWINKPERTLNTMKKEITYCSHPTEEAFLNSTRKYISELFGSINDGSDFMMVDQLVPPTNLKRYLRYFDDIKVIVVDRDPRDLYILEKYYWKDGVIPTSVVEFCKWYKYTRAHRNVEPFNGDKVCYIQFEDLIYNYEKTLKRIIDWLGLDPLDHKKKMKLFNPEISKKNTLTWINSQCDLKDIKYIEGELVDYLYFSERVGR